MNKYTFKVIFNKKLNRLVVTSELGKSAGKHSSKTFVTSSKSESLNIFSAYLKPLALGLFLALGFVNVSNAELFIKADKTASFNQQPQILKTANGLPQINIQTPNSHGLSHNRYSKFDINERGAILNNARHSVKTQLAGFVQGNPNLARGEAKIILNEVNSNDPSIMRGYLEVAGRRADIIVANPSGITCSGCGFINSNRVTLTTGKPNIQNGEIQGYNVRGGVVTVAGKGLDDSRVDYTEILAEQAKINGEIWSKKKLTVVVGKNKIKRTHPDDALQIEHVAADDTSVGKNTNTAQFAIDTGRLGGMYSQQIELVGTDAGLGVRNAGKIGASVGNVVIDAQGNIINSGDIVSAKHLNIHSHSNLENKGTMYATSGDIKIKAKNGIHHSGQIIAQSGQIQVDTLGNIEQSGETLAHKNIVYHANKINASTASTLAAGIDTDTTHGQQQRKLGKQSSDGVDLNLLAKQEITLQGKNIATHKITAQSDKLNLENSQNSAFDIHIVSQKSDLNANNAQISAVHNLMLATPKTLDITNGKLTSGNITLNQKNLRASKAVIAQTGNNDLNLDADSLQAQGSIISAKGNLNVQSNTLNNNSGNLISEGAINIHSREVVDNTNGKVVSQKDATINTKSLNNNKGLVQSDANIVINANDLRNINTKAKDSQHLATGIIANQLQIATNNFDNQNGGIYVANHNEISVREHLNNAQGEIVAYGKNATLDISSIPQQKGHLRIDNAQGLIQGNDISIYAKSMSLDGDIKANNANIHLHDSATLLKDILAGKTLTLDIDGDLVTNKKLLAQGTVNLNVNNLEQGNEAEINAGKTNITINNALTNRGLINSTAESGKSTTIIKANHITNIGTGRIYGDTVILEGKADTNSIINTDEVLNGKRKLAVIAGRNKVILAGNEIKNQTTSYSDTTKGRTTIFSGGDLVIAHHLDKDNNPVDQAQTIYNDSGRIEAMGSIKFNVNNIFNRNIHYKTTISTILDEIIHKRYIRPKDHPNDFFEAGKDVIENLLNNEKACRQAKGCFFNAKTHERYNDYWNFNINHKKVLETTVTSSLPGQILAGGDLTYKSDNFTNDKSSIIAGGTISALGKAKNIYNIDDETGIHKEILSGDKYFTWTYYKRSRYKYRRKYNEQGPVTLDFTHKKDMNIYTVETHTNKTTGMNIPLGYKPNINIVPITIPSTENKGIAQTIDREIRSMQVDTRLPDSAMYHISLSPNSHVVVETDPAFINHEKWLNSDYMYDQLRHDPNRVFKRLGDGFYEQQLIREQINRLTGRNFNGGSAAFEKEYKALMDNGIAFAKKFHLAVGVTLTPDQIKQLTTNIIWLQKENIVLPNGTTESVIVPKVYMIANQDDIDGNHTLISGDAINFSGATLNNSGTIYGRKYTKLDLDNLYNSGTLSGDIVSANLTHNFNNIGGNVEANKDIIIKAGGDVNNITTTRTIKVDLQGYKRTSTTVDREATLHVKDKDKDANILIQANNIHLVGADIENNGTGKTLLSARKDIKFDTVQTGFDEKMGGGDHYRNQSLTDSHISQINTQGDMILNGKNIISTGAHLNAQGKIVAAAKNDLILNSADRHTTYEEYHHTTEHNVVSKSSETTYNSEKQDLKIGTQISGKEIYLQANHDIQGKGADIVADNDVNIIAGHNVDLEADTEHFQEKHFREKTKSGLMSGGGIGVTIGERKITDEGDTIQNYSRGSRVGSLSGNVNIIAGKQYKQQASTVTSVKDNVNVKAQQIDIVAGNDRYNNHSKHIFEQKGLTIAVNVPAVQLLQDGMKTLKSVQKVGNSKNNRINAMAAANVAWDTMRMYDDVGSTIDATNALAHGNVKEANISISATYGEQKNIQETSIKGTNAHASKINAGGKVRIVATGAKEKSNLNIIGSDISGLQGTQLAADNDINIKAQSQAQQERSTNKSQGWNAGIAASYGKDGFAFGATAGGNYGWGYGNKDEQSWRASRIGSNQSHTSIISGKDTAILGSQVLGDSVALSSQNLTIKSLQDTMTYKGKQQNVSGQMTVGYGFSASGSYNQSNVKADYRSVNTQAGIFAGDNGFNVNVKNHTDLTGGLITSNKKAEQNHKNQFMTGTITTSTIKNHADYSGSGFGLSGGFSVSGGDAPKEIGGTKLKPIGNNQSDGSSKTEMQGLAGVGSQGNWGVAKGLTAALLSNVKDKGSEGGITTSRITTANIHITNVAEQEKLTGQTTEQLISNLNQKNKNQTVKKVDIQSIQKGLDNDLSVTNDFLNNIYETGDDIYYNIEKKKGNIYIKEKRAKNCHDISCIKTSVLDVDKLTPLKTRKEAERLARMYVHGVLNTDDSDRTKGAIQYGGKDYLDHDVLIVRKPYTSLRSELAFTIFERLRAGLDMPSIFGASNASREQTKVWALLDEYNRNHPNNRVSLRSLAHSLGASSSKNALNWADYEGMKFKHTTLKADIVGTSYPITNNTIIGKISGGTIDKGYTEEASKLFKDGSVEYAASPRDIVATGIGLPYIPGSLSIGIGNTDTTGDNSKGIPVLDMGFGAHTKAYYKDEYVIDFLYPSNAKESILSKDILNYQEKIWGKIGPKTRIIDFNKNTLFENNKENKR